MLLALTLAGSARAQSAEELEHVKLREEVGRLSRVLARETGLLQ